VSEGYASSGYSKVLAQGNTEGGAGLSLFQEKPLSYKGNHLGKLLALSQLVFYSPDNITHCIVFNIPKFLVDFR